MFIFRLMYHWLNRNIEVNDLLVLILATVAQFLGVLTEKNKKQRKSRKIADSLFREVLLNKKRIFIGNC